MASQRLRLTDAYIVGIKLRDHLREGDELTHALKSVSGPFDKLNDSYPDWHPAPYSFHGMLRLFLYREITGQSYRSLAQYPEISDTFSLERVPDESVLSRTWRNRFDDAVREFVTTAAHYVVKEIQDYGPSLPEVRPKAEVISPQKDPSELCDDKDKSSPEFTDEQIARTTRLARNYGFDGFDSGRATNASYDDTQFFELQSFMGMVGCGTPQGATRFRHRHGPDATPHGDTHLRAVKQFEPATLINGFDSATDQLLSLIESEASFRRPVTAAIDITTVPYYGDVEGMSMVSGTKDGEGRAFKFATLSIIGQNIPVVLGVEPIRESSGWDENPSNRIHSVVRRLVKRAKEHVSIETILCDREFDSQRVFQSLSNLGVNYLIPTRIGPNERDALETMEEDGEATAVESASVHLETGSHEMRYLYVPSTARGGTAVFATNLRVGPDEAETVCERYSDRWQIENEYKSIKNDFLAKTSSKDYRVRLFYFVFAVLLHNIWRLTDLLLKAEVKAKRGYAPVITAGECVEFVCSALVPDD